MSGADDRLLSPASRERQTTQTDGLPRHERGAALLVVLLFAAILAITLYQELPVANFEARRAKEQLLIDRGHEYVRAIQLYYRKFRHYPPSIDALEDTNRMRFLRHRYKDPFTGKDDWRLIHTNGLTLIDSKVNPLKAAKPSSTTQASSSGWFTNSTSDFESSPADQSSSQSQSSSEPPEIIVPQVRERGPAIPANKSTAQPDNPLEANPGDGDLNAELRADLGKEGLAATGAEPSAQPAGPKPAATPSQSNPMQMVRNMLSSESPLAPQQMQSGAGALHSGGIAGVASRAGGDSIKTINDQTDYSLWEFVYDPSKDTTGTRAIAAPSGAQPSSAPQPSSNSLFGSAPSGSESSSTPGSGIRILSPQ